MTQVDEALGARRILLMVFYEGPWEKVTNWLWKTNKIQFDENDNPIDSKHVVDDDSIRGRLAVWAERQDFKWRDKYARSDTRPNDRWKRESK